jgi:hypothetical protein
MRYLCARNVTNWEVFNAIKNKHKYMWSVCGVVYFMMLSRLQNVKWQHDIAKWNGKDLEGSSHDLIAVLPQNFPGGAEENHKKKSLLIASVLAKIHTEHLSISSPEHYCYITLLNHSCFDACWMLTWENGDIDPHILNFGTRRRSAVHIGMPAEWMYISL